jgi:tetratricopeptide (TPR) repeat protein
MKQELGDKRGIATTLHQLAMVQQDQGHLAEAVRLYEQSLQMNQELGNKSGIANTIGQMGRVSQQQGQLRAALHNYVTAWALFRELQSPYERTVSAWITEVRQQIGEEQFGAWLAEDFGAQEAGQIIEVLDEERSPSLEEVLNDLCGAVVAARREGSETERQELAAQLESFVAQAAENESLSAFLMALHGLLTGADIAPLRARLAEEYRNLFDPVAEAVGDAVSQPDAVSQAKEDAEWQQPGAKSFAGRMMQNLKSRWKKSRQQ